MFNAVVALKVTSTADTLTFPPRIYDRRDETWLREALQRGMKVYQSHVFRFEKELQPNEDDEAEIAFEFLNRFHFRTLSNLKPLSWTLGLVGLITSCPSNC